MNLFAPLLVNRDSTWVPTVGSSKVLVDVELVVLADAIRLAATSLQALGVVRR
jgi:hypothetical protein